MAADPQKGAPPFDPMFPPRENEEWSNADIASLLSAYEVKAVEVRRLRKVLEWIADVQRVETAADAHAWAIDAHNRAWDALYGDGTEGER